MKKKQTEKNYRSRYDRNRMCYRKDNTTYVYSEPVSKQAIDKRLKGIFKKIAENMSL